MYYEKKINSENSEWAIFIHGLGGSTKTWKYQVEAFQDYNSIYIDLHGHGNSNFIKSKNPAITAANKINEILEKENIKKAHFISLSLGTIITLEFARIFPDKILSITLAGCVLNLNFFKKAIVGIVEGLKYVCPSKILYPIFAKIIMPKSNHKLSRKIFVRESLKMPRKSFMSWINILFSSQKKLKDYVNSINKKKIPVLLVTGKEDYLFVSGVKKMKEKINNCKLSLIDHCGHVCSIDKKEIFNSIVLSFLDMQKLKPLQI